MREDERQFAAFSLSIVDLVNNLMIMYSCRKRIVYECTVYIDSISFREGPYRVPFFYLEKIKSVST